MGLRGQINGLALKDVHALWEAIGSLQGGRITMVWHYHKGEHGKHFWHVRATFLADDETFAGGVAEGIITPDCTDKQLHGRLIEILHRLDASIALNNAYKQMNV